MFLKDRKKNRSGFTLIELIIVISILAVLSTIVVVDFVSYKKNSDLDNSTQEFAGILRLAQSKTLSSENYKQYGVYINTAVVPNQYTLFTGYSYALRTTSLDQIYFLQPSMEFYGISLGGGNEIVFDRLTGASDESGSVSIRVKADTSKNKTVYVSSSGAVGFIAPPINFLDADRVVDTRHEQFLYTRPINTVDESIVLTFDNSESKPIKISDNITNGQILWSGTSPIDGSDQVLEINTHQLNSPYTLFSIRRDRRYNNKSLKVSLTGDTTGYLIQYFSDGRVDYASAYVQDLTPQ